MRRFDPLGAVAGGGGPGAPPQMPVRIVIEPGQAWLRECWWSGVEVVLVEEVDAARMRVVVAAEGGGRRTFGVSELLERWLPVQGVDSIAL